MDVKNLHHVGIVLPDEETCKLFAGIFGLVEERREYVDDYKTLCIFMCGNGASAVEFVIPNGGNLATWNNGRGGLHHIAFEVEDVRAAREELIARGLQLLGEEPVDAGEIIVNFIPPRSAHGVLVELIEKK